MPRLMLNFLTGEFDYILRRGEYQHVGESLVGDVDGTNVTFYTQKPFLVNGSVSIAVYLNGVRLHAGATSDYVISESGGPGTGYDTVILAVAPRSTPTLDNLVVDYTER